MSELADLQKAISRTRADRGFVTDPVKLHVLLSEEIGEIASEIKRLWSKNYGDFDRDRLKDEIADVLVLLAALAAEFDIDIEEAVVEKFFQLGNLWGFPPGPRQGLHPLLPRHRTEFANPLQHFIEHVPGHHHLCKLEHKPPGMAHQSSTCLNEPRLNTCQGPALYRFWQSQPSEEVAQVVGQACPEHVEGMKSHSRTWLATNRWQPRPVGAVQSVLTLLDPLLRRASTIVEADYPFRRTAEIGNNEAYSWKSEEVVV